MLLCQKRSRQVSSHSIVHCSAKLAYAGSYSNHAATTHLHKHSLYCAMNLSHSVNSVLQGNIPYHKLSDNQHTLDCVHSPQCTQPVHRQRNTIRLSQMYNHTCYMYHTNCWINPRSMQHKTEVQARRVILMTMGQA